MAHQEENEDIIHQDDTTHLQEQSAEEVSAFELRETTISKISTKMYHIHKELKKTIKKVKVFELQKSIKKVKFFKSKLASPSNIQHHQSKDSSNSNNATNSLPIPDHVIKQRESEIKKYEHQVQSLKNLDLESYQHILFIIFIHRFIKEKLVEKYDLVKEPVMQVLLEIVPDKFHDHCSFCDKNSISLSVQSLVDRSLMNLVDEKCLNKLMNSKLMVEFFKNVSFELLYFIDSKNLKKEKKKKMFKDKVEKEKKKEKGKVGHQQAKENDDNDHVRSRIDETLFIGSLSANVNDDDDSNSNNEGEINHDIIQYDEDDEYFSDATDVEEVIAPKKNRPGQRRRRELWEQKYGKNANHIKNRTENDMKLNGKNKYGKRNNESNTGSMHRKRKKMDAFDNEQNTRILKKSIPSGSKYDEKKKQSQQQKQHGKPALHPSWEAKKKQNSILEFSGQKITFDSDNDD